MAEVQAITISALMAAGWRPGEKPGTWLAPAGEWQPIESAPRDGREVLLSRVGIGEVVRVGFWDLARGGVWSKWPGREPMEPTRWQPLPHPPQD